MLGDDDRIPLLRAAPKPKLTIGRTILLTCFALGINYGWNIFFVLSAPLFTSLGMSYFWNSFATASGPVTGLLQPLFGMWMDSSQSRFGKRKPFLLGGLVVSMVGMLTFANCQVLGNLFGASDSENTAAIVIAVISLWLFNLGLNVIQAAGMSLVMDICVDELDLDRGTTFVSVMSGVATLSANFMGFINFVPLGIFKHNYQYLYYIGVLLIPLSTLPTILFVKEEKQVTRKSDDASFIESIRKGALLKMLKKNSAAFRLLLPYFFGSAAQYVWSLYFTTYMAQDVFHGRTTHHGVSCSQIPSPPPSCTAFDDGVRWGSLTMGLMGTVTVLFSFALSPLTKLIGHKGLWLACSIWLVVPLALPIYPPMSELIPAVVLGTSTGIFNAFFNSVPWVILSRAVDHDHMGLWTGILNMSQVAAQLISGSICGVVADAYVGSQLGSVTVGIFSGSVWGLVMIPLIFPLVVPDATEEDLKSDTLQVTA